MGQTRDIETSGLSTSGVVCFTRGNENPQRGMVSMVFVYYLKDLHHTSLQDTPAL